MSAPAWLGFLVAAGVGAPARYLLDGWVQDRMRTTFPFGTLAVNLSGCLVLGTITGLALYHGLSPTTRTMIGTGGLGAYTTFSTFTFETVRLVEGRATKGAVSNVVISIVGGIAAAACGLALMAAI